MQNITADTIRATLADGDLGMALSDFHAWAAATKAPCLDEATELLHRHHHAGRVWPIDWAEKSKQDSKSTQALLNTLGKIPAPPAGCQAGGRPGMPANQA